MADKFEDLRTFVAVMSAGGINAAAAKLDIAKSAVSRRVSELEERLGVILIERSTRRFEPTRAGVEYFRRSQAILASLDDLDAMTSSTRGWRRITIAAPSAVITHVLPARLRSVIADLHETVLEFLPNQDADRENPPADITIDTAEVSGAINRNLTTTRRVTCAAHDYLTARGTPESADELGRHILIGIGEVAAANWQFSGEPPERIRISVATSDEEAAATAAIAGMGLVQLPDMVVARALDAGQLVPVLTDFAPTPSNLYATCASNSDAVVRQVLDALTSA